MNCFETTYISASILISISIPSLFFLHINFNTEKEIPQFQSQFQYQKKKFLDINFNFNTKKEIPRYQFQFQYQRNLFLDFNFNINIPNQNPQSRFQYQYVNFPFCDINTTSISIFLQYFDFNLNILFDFNSIAHPC